ncbi:hypothetical protein ABFS82_10G140100 [Erythranthe guttata]|uniref:F-box protein At5g07610-like n=1 Tax=Erythranthe guttata TaxID=4155 RepID=UPI00064D7A4D|nr:PREDICTED: F-box protein At5g07610-like [Erythranthe guttata]|eukprot:XP_012837569.1 PREDICTED: F-box protein At5g07610-like [Erythranthe guttata]
MDPKRSRSQQSAEIIAGNDDLLTELILLRLPARSLIKFKSVSKRWQSLISAPLFGAAHTKHHSRRRETQPSLILGTAAEPPEFFYFNPTTRVFLPYTFQHPYTKILQSSHGLLLLACRNSQFGRVHYRVHNPTTNQSKKLENMHENKNMLTWILGMSLSYDPRTSPYYKIICTRRSPLPYSGIGFEIYHSEFDRWEHVPGGDIYRCLLGIRLSKGLSCNNDGIYWIQPTSPESYYFNIRTRHLEKLSGNYAHRRKMRPCSNKNKLLVSNGRVHCVSTYFGPKVKCLIVYELLSDHNSGWVEKCWADLGPFLEVDEGPVGLLGIVRGEKEEYSSVLLLAPGKIICYWFLDRRFEVLCDFTSSEIYKEDDQLQFRSFRSKFSCQFIESLVPV